MSIYDDNIETKSIQCSENNTYEHKEGLNSHRSMAFNNDYPDYQLLELDNFKTSITIKNKQEHNRCSPDRISTYENEDNEDKIEQELK